LRGKREASDGGTGAIRKNRMDEVLQWPPR
jgi:hypothetical protein